jgi:hypothetical protein
MKRGATMAADYEIYVRRRLGPEMRHELADLHPQVRSAHTRLTARDADQAALHGILARLRDLALEVDSVWRTDGLRID